MTWPNYSKACRKDVDDLLKAGGSLSAYRANPLFPSWTGPSKGSWADRLERDIERRFRVKHCVVVNSGTAALHAALASLRLKPGEEVITTPYTFSATTAAICLAGGVPVFADVDPYNFCLSKETVKHAITKRTRAVLAVHLFGGLAPVRELESFGLPVIEDGCQSVGAKNEQGYSGTLGLAGCHSVNGTKNIPGGEGGFLTTNSDQVAESARYLVNHGENFHQKQVGYNYRLNELSACVAWHGLQELEKRNVQRSILAGTVQMKLWSSDLYRLPRFQSCQRLKDGTVEQHHVWYVFPFQVKPGTREKFIKRMAKKGFQVGAGYITPTLDRYPAFRRYARGPLPNVHKLSKQTLCIFAGLTPDRDKAFALSFAKAIEECV